jgi:hypothetical protein
MKLPQDCDNSCLIPKHCCVVRSEQLSLKMCTSSTCLFLGLSVCKDGKTAECIFIKSDITVLLNGLLTHSSVVDPVSVLGSFNVLSPPIHELLQPLPNFKQFRLPTLASTSRN